MKYSAIDRSLFIKNRAKFMNKMNAKSIAFFNSNDLYPVSADTTLPFEQHRDLFYLSGINQEESILVLCPNCKNSKHREILFLTKPNETLTHWEGEKLSKENAFMNSGVKTVYWLEDLEKIL
ncbi:aminopeptidase P N-terminal domain-containing protein, partial [Flavobacteriaceae bacterium]|nr:aminopeptidase P N-terminal domain-containing protein [Flavobacteriaceae bacterium]